MMFLLFAAGVYLSAEGIGNVIFWKGKTRFLWQVGRTVRVVIGLVLILVSLF
jgi:hypothetical protein